MLTGLPDLARAMALAVRDEGGRALVVGGWVRDALLGRTSKDVDLEVFGVPGDRLLARVTPRRKCFHSARVCVEFPKPHPTGALIQIRLGRCTVAVRM